MHIQRRLPGFIAGATLLMTLIILLVSQGNIQAQEANPVNAPLQTTVNLEGWLGDAHYDPEPGSGLEYRYYNTLIDDLGNETLLIMSPALARAYTGQRVYITGQRAATPQNTLMDVQDTIEVSSIFSIAQPLETAANKSIKYVTILCTFPNSGGQNQRPFEYFDSLLQQDGRSPGSQWAEMTYGQLDLSSSVVIHQWFPMPNVSSAYSDAVQAQTDCLASADSTVDFSPYEGINVMLDMPYVNYALGGRRNVSVDGGTRVVRFTINPPFGYITAHVTAHELGHSVGLLHSYGHESADRYPYDSHWDLMSGGGDNFKLKDSTYSYISADTLLDNIYFLGHLSESRRVVVPDKTSTTVTIQRMIQPASGTSIQLIHIPINGPTVNIETLYYYTVEFRGFVGFDEALPNEGVVITDQVWDGTRNAPGRVVDGDNNNDVNDEGGVWTIGEMFTDSANNIRIKVLGRTSDDDYVVWVSNDTNETPPADIGDGAVPIADDVYDTLINTPLSVPAIEGVLANDNYSGTANAEFTSDPANGTITSFNADGSFTYIPNTDFTGSDTFQYHYTQNGETTEAATVTINVVASSPDGTPIALNITGTALPLMPTFNWLHPRYSGNTLNLGDWYNVTVKQNGVEAINAWYPVEQVCQGMTCSIAPNIELYATGRYEWTVSVWDWTNEAALQGTLITSRKAYFKITSENAALPSFTVNVDQGRPSLVLQNDPNTAWWHVYTATSNFSQQLDFNWYRKDQAVCDSSTCILLLNAHPIQEGSYITYVEAWGPGGFSTGGISGSSYAPGVTFNVNLDAPAAIAPITAANTNSGRPTFQWSAVPGATWYNIEVRLQGSGVLVSSDWYPAAENGCPIPGDICTITPNWVLPQGNSYTWQAAPWGVGLGSGAMPYTSGSFSVSAASPAVPQLIGFTSTVTTAAPTFAWNKVQDASWYEIIVKRGSTEVYRNWHPLEALGCHVSTVCSLVLPDVYLRNANHSFTVRAYTPAGLGSYAPEAVLTVARP